MFSEEKLSQAGQKKPTKYWYKTFLLKYIVRFATWKNCISKLSIKIFIKKPKAVKTYSYRMTSVTHKNFFNFTPDNCVRCEAALSDITRFFARHCLIFGAKTNAFSVHYHCKTEQKLYTANWQNYFETKTKRALLY